MKFFASWLSLFMLALIGCTKEEMPGDEAQANGPTELRVGASIEAPDNPTTRAQAGYNVVPALYQTSDFYITVYQEEEGNSTAKKWWSIYEIPSGTEGTISSTSQSDEIIEKNVVHQKFSSEFRKTLNWHSRENKHYFYGWVARRSFFEYTKEYALANMKGTGEGGALTEEEKQAINDKTFPIEQLADGNIKINFVDNNLFEATSGGAWRASYSSTYDMGTSGVGTTGTDFETQLPYHWKNGEVLERLVGTCNGPLTYNANGIYVPLQFRHLVSKIMLSSFLLTDNSTGTPRADLKGYITFYGLPKEVILYTNPVDAEGHPKAPYVDVEGGMGNWDYDQTQGVRYAITNSARAYSWEYSSSPWWRYYFSGGYSSDSPTSSSYTQYRDAWYICPEVDFDKITFKIELYEYSDGKWIPSTTHGKHGAYYGDFKNVTFSRNGSGYDDDKLADGTRPDLKTLHAGEYMELTIRMTEKGNPVVKSEISDWPDAVARTGSSHIHPGIYDLSELKNMSDIMKSKNEQGESQFYDFYGDGTTDKDDPKEDYWPYDPPKKVIELYDDIGSAESGTSSNTKMNEGIYVDDDYILDGNGHTINCTSSSMSIGNVRDVYLRYYSSPNEYIIYIDKEGYVWTVDPATYERTKTGNNVNEMGKNPMTVNLSSGKLS